MSTNGKALAERPRRNDRAPLRVPNVEEKQAEDRIDLSGFQPLRSLREAMVDPRPVVRVGVDGVLSISRSALRAADMEDANRVDVLSDGYGRIAVVPGTTARMSAPTVNSAGSVHFKGALAAIHESVPLPARWLARTEPGVILVDTDVDPIS